MPHVLFSLSLFFSEVKMSRLKLTTLILCAFFVYTIDAHGHSHDGGHGHAHDHGHGHGHDEPASFKWSRQANVKEGFIPLAVLLH